MRQRVLKELVIVDTIQRLEDFYSPLNAYTLLEDESYTGWLLHTYANQINSLVVFDKKDDLYERPLKVRQNNKSYTLPVYTKTSKAFSSQTASSAKIKLNWKEVTLSKNIGTLRGTLFHEILCSMFLSLSRRRNYFLCGMAIIKSYDTKANSCLK